MKKFSSYLIPSVISSVLMSMYAIIDGIFIGQEVGDIGLAAINIAWPITAVLQSIGQAVGLAGGICIQTYLGKNEEEKANKLKLTTLLLVIILSIIFGGLFYIFKEPLIRVLGSTNDSFEPAVEYIKIILIGSAFQMLGMALIPLLKNSGKVKLALFASIASMCTNLLLDYLLICVFKMGLTGAAIGSILAQGVSALICLIAYFKELKGVDFSINNIKDILITSLAPFILAYSYSIVIIITNIACKNFGGDEAIAAYTLLSYICYIYIASTCAVGDSIQPLFSYNEAKGDLDTNKKMLTKCLIISSSICVIYGVLLAILKKPLGNLYNLSDTAYDYYSDGLIYYILGGLLLGVIKVISSYFYATNKKVRANLLVFLEPFVLTPLGIAILPIIFDLYGIWVTYLFVQVGLAITAISLMIFKKNKFQNLSSNKN